MFFNHEPYSYFPAIWFKTNVYHNSFRMILQEYVKISAVDTMPPFFYGFACFVCFLPSIFFRKFVALNCRETK